MYWPILCIFLLINVNKVLGFIIYDFFDSLTAYMMYDYAMFIIVGNIPYEASEEQLKEIFSDVGPVVSFRLTFMIDIIC